MSVIDDPFFHRKRGFADLGHLTVVDMKPGQATALFRGKHDGHRGTLPHVGSTSRCRCPVLHGGDRWHKDGRKYGDDDDDDQDFRQGEPSRSRDGRLACPGFDVFLHRF